MQDVPNGTNDSTTGDQSTSGSESGRGRLRRKRSREDFEDEEKPIEKKHERHLRKKSRDVTSPHDTEAEVTTNPLKSSVSRIDEHDDDETMATGDIHSQSGNSASNRPVTPEAPTSQDKENAIISPKNKRTHDQTKGGDEVDAPSNDVQATDKAAEEPNPKRHRDKDDLQAPLDGKESKTKVSLIGTFRLNTSNCINRFHLAVALLMHPRHRLSPPYHRSRNLLTLPKSPLRTSLRPVMRNSKPRDLEASRPHLPHHLVAWEVRAQNRHLPLHQAAADSQALHPRQTRPTR